MMVMVGFACICLWLSIWDGINGIPERLMNHTPKDSPSFTRGNTSHVGKLTNANSLLDRKPM